MSFDELGDGLFVTALDDLDTKISTEWAVEWIYSIIILLIPKSAHRFKK